MLSSPKCLPVPVDMSQIVSFPKVSSLSSIRALMARRVKYYFSSWRATNIVSTDDQLRNNIMANSCGWVSYLAPEEENGPAEEPGRKFRSRYQGRHPRRNRCGWALLWPSVVALAVLIAPAYTVGAFDLEFVADSHCEMVRPGLPRWRGCLPSEGALARSQGSN